MKLLFEQEANQKLLKGCEIVYKAVGSTFSPRGRNVAIQRYYGFPAVLADGVSVAREVYSDDPYEQIGIDIIREAAEKQVLECGDGTTVVSILTYHLIEKGLKLVEEGVNPMIIRNQMNAALPKLVARISEYATPVKDLDQLVRVATISGGSVENGELVAKALDKIGTDGIITVDESKTGETYVEYVEGLRINSGYVSPYFVTDPARMEATLSDCAVVVIGKRLTLAREIVNILKTIIGKNKTMVIFADIQGDALRILIENKMRGAIQCLVVNPPLHGDRRMTLMQDIALATGATYIDANFGIDQEFKAEWIGGAERVHADREETVIVGGKGDEQTIAAHVDALRTNIKTATSVFEVEKFRERLAKLTTGLAVVRVGAKTEVAVKEQLERIKDAIGSTRAAQTEGIVPGGATTFLRLANDMYQNDSNFGESLIFHALQEPIQKLLVNSGKNESEIDNIIHEVYGDLDGKGYNALNDKVENLLEAGVIDPAKVVRNALENSINVAGVVLTTGTLIPLKKTENQNG